MSVTLTATIKVPSSTNLCDLSLGSVPVAVALNVVCAEPSPQSTSTAQGLSGPGSVNEPRANVLAVPSVAVWLAAAVTVGATLAAVAWNVADPVLESVLFVTRTVTV